MQNNWTVIALFYYCLSHFQIFLPKEVKSGDFEFSSVTRISSPEAALLKCQRSSS